jgi:hypothetical protein
MGIILCGDRSWGATFRRKVTDERYDRSIIVITLATLHPTIVTPSEN